jgi:hypothetical protein
MDVCGNQSVGKQAHTSAKVAGRSHRAAPGFFHVFDAQAPVSVVAIPE